MRVTATDDRETFVVTLDRREHAWLQEMCECLDTDNTSGNCDDFANDLNDALYNPEEMDEPATSATGRTLYARNNGRG